MLKMWRLAAVWFAFYVPLEIWLSWPDLLHPLFIVDVVGMSLFAAAFILRYRAKGAALAWLVAAWSWTGANFWRGTVDRFDRLAGGDPTALVEAWCGVVLTVILMTLMVFSLSQMSPKNSPASRY